MKIKDIVNEGFWTSLLPTALGKAIDAGKKTYTPTDKEVASQAQQMFGDNPESELPGVQGWLDPVTQKKIKDLRSGTKAPPQPKPKKQKPTGPAAPGTTATQPPPQVRLASGEYITKYGSSWYDEQGQRIAIPSDINKLERMAQGPSGQSQMASTKNMPVALPGYKGKRK